MTPAIAVSGLVKSYSRVRALEALCDRVSIISAGRTVDQLLIEWPRHVGGPPRGVLMTAVVGAALLAVRGRTS